ncbi:MAG: TauD/TfdA dioxygenase family protein [Alphaproteobacteria bacterium]
MTNKPSRRPLPQMAHPRSHDMIAAVLHAPQVRPMSYQSFDLSPLSGALGAEIFGAKLDQLSESMMSEIEGALADHLVLAFRDLDLSPESQIALARRLGSVTEWPYATPMADYRELTELVSGPGDVNNFGGSWHTDSSTFENPPKYTLLYCVDCPPAGGDTSFANQYLAWDTLPDEMKQALEDLRLVHSTKRGFADHSDGAGSPTSTTTPVSVPLQHQNLVSAHPVARTHPVTGRKALYVNSGFSTHFEGWSEEESESLRDALGAHGSLPDFTCRVTWRPGTLLIWDNRCTLHYAHNDYRGQNRTVRRAVVEGEQPE